MKIVGLIAEYNPFHKGHQYHIEETKRLTGADAVVVIMSGNFVQRGEPAIMPKRLRAESALKAGASLVIELPVCYATGSAEQFAYGAISILQKLGCIDALCFGSECGSIEQLLEIADILSNESEEFKTALQQQLKTGLPFPLARQRALEQLYPERAFGELLGQPNNILGIEYLKALKRLNSSIRPVTLKRQDSAYHDTVLRDTFSSASAIRASITKGALDTLKDQVPTFTYETIKEPFGKRYPIYANDFSMLLKYRLLNETKTSLSQYADISEELANRIYKHRNEYMNYEQFCELLKTKEVTYTRISRALLHIILNIKKTDYTEIPYAHVLGFRKDCTNVMSEIKMTSSIPLVSKLTTFSHSLLTLDIYASNIYESVVTDKYKTSFSNEYEHPVVRI